ncbi:MAG: hypothetical protein ABSD78_16460 [Acidimicrobiales bacterium]|jgi:hypothetical protein
MDVSSFDFSLDEVVDILSRLPGLAKIVEIEPRVHDAEEETHTGIEPTFRIRCQLLLGDKAIRQLAAIEAEAGVDTVLDHDSTVRLRRVPPDQLARGGTAEQV